MPTDTGAPLSAAATIAAAVAQQAAAAKMIAEAEIPLLQQAQAALTGPEGQAFRTQLAAVAPALTPGNSATMLRNLLQFFDGAVAAIPNDLNTRQRAVQS